MGLLAGVGENGVAVAVEDRLAFQGGPFGSGDGRSGVNDCRFGVVVCFFISSKRLRFWRQIYFFLCARFVDRAKRSAGRASTDLAGGDNPATKFLVIGGEVVFSQPQPPKVVPPTTDLPAGLALGISTVACERDPVLREPSPPKPVP